MKRVNVLLYLGAVWIFGMGWFSHRAFTAPQVVTPEVYLKIDSLESEISNRDSVIFSLEEENDILEDACQMKESEISYWGRKYDSLRWGKK
jgi:hypothetical protein